MTIVADPRKHLRLVLAVGISALAINLGFYLFAVRPRAQTFEALESSAGTLDRDLVEAQSRQSGMEA
jgi:hypothetical protein